MNQILTEPAYNYPQAVVFDVFGTLLEIGKQHHPYLSLMKYLRAHGRPPQTDDSRFILTFDGSIAELAAHFDATVPADQLAEYDTALEADLNNISCFSDVAATFTALRLRGCRIAICSNLAQPYGSKVMELLPSADVYAMSYELGCIKPEPQIYQYVLDKLNLPANECIFIGDSEYADQDGPIAMGMDGRLVSRQRGQKLMDALADILV
ncbi:MULTISPECIES: HAD family hydrolase [Deefgea]|uniref:HAD-IA family hydrolase n=1 Tax=Deefgea chitinilytica TaxID=570276 RepID=A0ABS2C8Q8_9NEIS|nr:MULTISPECIES: HAD family hydrolase [Deefgea]MBM5570534.1 HAD-IA family hydrolase [Deefgea chitinilytica]MBM9887763.1 HAD family hydrolase [Deefgea sp. CFH1-16]